VVDKDFQNGKPISRLIAVDLTDLEAEIRFRMSHITWRIEQNCIATHIYIHYLRKLSKSDLNTTKWSKPVYPLIYSKPRVRSPVRVHSNPSIVCSSISATVPPCPAFIPLAQGSNKIPILRFVLSIFADWKMKKFNMDECRGGNDFQLRYQLFV